jgi:hypothetical protein
MNICEHIQLFGMSMQLVERELDAVESQLALDLQRSNSNEDKDEEFYPQFKEVFRREASDMRDHYELFYCLERSIRDLISEKLLAEKGPNWWEEAVPDPVKMEAAKNIKREQESGVRQDQTKRLIIRISVNLEKLLGLMAQRLLTLSITKKHSIK